MKKYIFPIFILIIGVLIGYTFILQTPYKKIKTNKKHTSSPFVRVTEVIDGDTFKIDSGEKVRLVGVDTPELHHPKKPVQCFGKEAMAKTKKLIEGKTVRLEKDVSETDMYGRLLRLVYLSNDSNQPVLFLNNYLVEEGFARIATFPPDVKFAELFRQSQQEAMKNNKGLWKDCKNILK